MTTATEPQLIQDAPDGPGILTQADDGSLLAWDWGKRSFVAATLRMSGGQTVLRAGASRIQDAPDGPGSLGSGDNGKALVWDNATGRFVMTAFEASGAVAAHVAEADPHTGYLLATGSRAGASSQAQAFTNGIITGKVYPASDSTNAVGLYRADGTTQDVYYDSVNGRLGIGTVPTVKLDVALTSTGTSGGSTNGVLITNTVSPSGASTQEVRSLNLSATLDTAQNFSGSNLLIGVRGEVRAVNAGTVGMATAGVYGVGMIAGSNGATLGAATEVNGVYAVPISSFSNALSATVTRAYGAHVKNMTNSGSGPLTVTAQIGLGIDALSGATNNIYILLGTNTAPSGTYAIYSTGSTAISYFNANIGVGTTAASARFHAAGSQSVAAWGLNGVVFQGAASTITDSSTAASGTATNAVANSFGRPTFAATNSSVTMTNAATVYIANSPAAGTNVTLTNAYALWVDDGASRFDGNVGFFATAPVAKQTVTGSRDSNAALASLLTALAAFGLITDSTS